MWNVSKLLIKSILIIGLLMNASLAGASQTRTLTNNVPRVKARALKVCLQCCNDYRTACTVEGIDENTCALVGFTCEAMCIQGDFQCLGEDK